MTPNSDRATPNPKVAARSLNRGPVGVHLGCRGLPTTLLMALLVLAGSFAVGSAKAAQLMPFRGSTSTVAGRNVAGEKGASYQLPAGIVVTFGPNSEGSVVTQPQMLALKPGKRTPTYSVFLNSGRVDIDIPSSSDGAVIVAAPASVRIITQKGRASALSVGRTTYAYSPNQALLVSQKERLSTLRAGIIRQFTPDAPVLDVPALGAPHWLSGRHVWLALPSDAEVSEFSWSPVADAQAYAVQLRRQETGETIAEFTFQATHVGALPRLSAGNYLLAVRAIDKLGLPGLESTPFRLQVVGVDVPPGASLKPDARIELRPTQTIQLNNAAGLSLTRSRERAKRPAGDPVGVSDGKPTPLLIHNDDDSAPPCLMWLLPSKVPVQAVAGPKWVVWPQQSVTLQVQWVDALGNRLAPEIEPVVSVFVGIEPIDVVWEKHPDYWQATLSPQPGNGPWVVRLEVRDQQGGLLARDFVEVQRRSRRAILSVASYGDLAESR